MQARIVKLNFETFRLGKVLEKCLNTCVGQVKKTSKIL